MVKFQSLQSRMLAGGTLFGELRRCWLQLAAWQLTLAVVSLAAALAAHDVVSALFLFVAVLAFRAVSISVASWKAGGPFVQRSTR